MIPIPALSHAKSIRPAPKDSGKVSNQGWPVQRKLLRGHAPESSACLVKEKGRAIRFVVGRVFRLFPAAENRSNALITSLPD